MGKGRFGYLCTSFLLKIRKPEQRPTRVFLVLGLIFGLLFVFLIPPMQGADEPNHFMRAYQVSQLNFVSDYVSNSRLNIGFPANTLPPTNVGGALPTSLVNFVGTALGNLPAQPNIKYDKKHFKALGNIRPTKTTVNADFVNTAVYSPAAYIPELPGLWFGRALGVKPLTLMYLTRLSALIIGLTLFAAAIYLMPFARLAAAAIALLPMSILQLSIITADTMTLALSFLFIATVLKLSFSKCDVTVKWTIALLVMAGMLSLTKPGLFLLSFTSLGLLANKFVPKKKALWLALVTILLSFSLAVWWNGLIKNLAIFGYQADYAYYKGVFGTAVNYSQQVHFVLTQPLTYLRVLYQSFLTVDFNSVPVSLVGNFGWQDAQLPLIFIIAGFIIVALSFFISSQSEEVKLPRWFKTVNLLIALGICIFTATSIYLLTVPVKYHSVLEYMQGRYFITAIFLLIPVFMGSKKHFSAEHYSNLSKKCLIASTILLMVMSYVVWVRYYNVGPSMKTLWHEMI